MSSPPAVPQPPNTDAVRRSGRPYVGPRTFEEREANRFFGRDREARDLLALVVRERLVLFYAQSGAGKSSLLNARLVPDLRAQGFEVLPVGRVSGVVPTTVDPVAITNVFVYNLILSLNQGFPEAQRAPETALAATSLLAYLGGEEIAQADGASTAQENAAQEELAATVLVIDQFEELVTTNLDHWQERDGFFRQVSAALERLPNLWVVLTLREDYVARLDPYAELLPNRMRARFYMERMGVPAALEAVTRPAADYGHPFAPGVAETLVDNLRRVRVHSEDEPHLGQYVEPVQLQVVCFQLWDKLNGPGGRWRTATDAESQIITEGDLPLDYIDQALTLFYEDAIRDVVSHPLVQATGLNERVLRDWFSRQLITDAGIRNSLLRNEESKRTGGLPNVAVDRLARHYLVRTELRAGGAWVELVHDRFVEPILEANRDWLLRQSPLLRAAQEWQDNGRQPERLLLAPQLAVLAGEVAAAKQDPLIAEFVVASEAAAKAEADRQAAIQREQELAQAQLRAHSAQERLLVEANRAAEQEQAARRLRQQLGVIIFVGFLAIVAAIVAGVAGSIAYQLKIEADVQKDSALLERSAALTAEANADAQSANAKTALSIALVEKIAAQTAQADAYAQATTAAVARAIAIDQLVTSVAVQQTLEAQRLAEGSARETADALAANLAILLTRQATTATPAPTEPPGATLETTPLPGLTPTPTPSPTVGEDSTGTPTAPVAQTADNAAIASMLQDFQAAQAATAQAITEQTATAQAAATATAQASTPTPTSTATSSLLAGSAIAPGEIVVATTRVNVRTEPAATASNVIGQLEPNIGVLALDPWQGTDGLTWWRISGIAPNVGEVTGYVLEQTADGTRLLEHARQLPGTDIPDPDAGRYLRAPYDGAYVITQLFGENATYYSQFSYDGVPLKGNTGVDLALPAGTPLFAVDEGVVTRAELDDGGLGNFVLIEHAWGQSLYAHLDSYSVAAGEAVQRGQPIGASGNTGSGAGPFLKFSIRINPYERTDGWGGFSDPLPYLPPESYVLPPYITAPTQQAAQ